jgi:hypothetical protein
MRSACEELGKLFFTHLPASPPIPLSVGRAPLHRSRAAEYVFSKNFENSFKTFRILCPVNHVFYGFYNRGTLFSTVEGGSVLQFGVEVPSMPLPPSLLFFSSPLKKANSHRAATVRERFSCNCSRTRTAPLRSRLYFQQAVGPHFSQDVAEFARIQEVVESCLNSGELSYRRAARKRISRIFENNCRYALSWSCFLADR